MISFTLDDIESTPVVKIDPAAPARVLGNRIRSGCTLYVFAPDWQGTTVVVEASHNGVDGWHTIQEGTTEIEFTANGSKRLLLDGYVRVRVSEITGSPNPIIDVVFSSS